MAVDLLDVISIITVFQLLLLAIFLIGHKKGNRLSNQILSAFLFSNALLIAKFILFRLKILTFNDFPHFFFIGNTYLLLMPLLYLYTKSLCYQKFTLKRMDVLHLVPYVLVVFFLIVDFHIRSQANGDSTSPPAITLYGRIISSGVLHIQILCYMIITLRTLHVYHLELKKRFSSVERIALSWLVFLLITFILMWLIDVTGFILGITKAISGSTQYIMALFSLTINFVFAAGVTYKGLKQPRIFSGIEEKPKYAEQKLTSFDNKRYVEQLTTYMQNKKPYLTPSLSLNDLAGKLLIPPRILSQVINGSMNQNFFDFVNSYRIEEAKRILLDPSSRHKTVLEILYEVGFNSKSVFNSAFKKHIGMTPTQFRKSHKI